MFRNCINSEFNALEFWSIRLGRKQFLHFFLLNTSPSRFFLCGLAVKCASLSEQMTTVLLNIFFVAQPYVLTGGQSRYISIIIFKVLNWEPRTHLWPYKAATGFLLRQLSKLGSCYLWMLLVRAAERTWQFKWQHLRDLSIWQCRREPRPDLSFLIEPETASSRRNQSEPDRGDRSDQLNRLRSSERPDYGESPFFAEQIVRRESAPSKLKPFEFN